jgi:hypothetical protein
MQLRIPFLFTSFMLQQKLVGRGAESRLLLAIWARMAPAVAPATTMLLVSENDIVFIHYRNMPPVIGRRVSTARDDAPLIQIFIHC